MKYNEPDEKRCRFQPVEDDASPSEAAEGPPGDDHELDENQFRVLADQIGLYDDVPEADDIALGFYVPTTTLSSGAGYHGEYRGWYGNRWCPRQSKFGGPRPRKPHDGADIFSPLGTRLIAVVGPAQIQWNPRGTTGHNWGNHLFLNFKWNDGKNYTFVYAHLHSLVGSAPRKVNLGETICTSGCSGNAGGPGMYCGTENRCGGKSDHLHVELIRPNGIRRPFQRIDPIGWLGSNMKYANDNRCMEGIP